MSLNYCFYLSKKKKYWCGTSGQRQVGDEEMEMNGHVDHDSFERNPQGIHAGIKIRQLRKVIHVTTMFITLSFRMTFKTKTVLIRNMCINNIGIYSR